MTEVPQDDGSTVKVPFADPLGLEDLENDIDLQALILQRQRGPMSKLTKILIAASAILVVFFAGAWTQQHFGSTSGQNSPFPNFGAAGGRNMSFGPPSNFTSDATRGEISLVDGNHVYVTTSSGNIVKVNVATDTTITLSKTGSANDLIIGEQVTVRGKEASNGTVQATSITQGAQVPGLQPIGN